MNELIAIIQEVYESFAKDIALQMENGTKAVGTRARKASLEILLWCEGPQQSF